MKISLPTTFLIILAISHPFLSAEIINADFQGKLFGIVGPSGDGSSFSGQGALADTGNDLWNGISLDGNGADFYPSFTTPTLVDSQNTTTTVTLTIGQVNGTYYHYNQSAFGPPDANWATGFGSLLGDYLDGGGGGSSVTINNLTPSGVYNFYLYGTASGSGGSSFRIGNLTRNTLSPNGPHSLTQDVDYVVFSGVAANSSGTITINYTRAFAGLQIENTMTVVQPSTQQVINADFQGKTFGIVGPNGDGSVFIGQGAVADNGNDAWNGIALTGNGYNGGENDTYPSFTTPALFTSSDLITPVTLTIGPPDGFYFHFNQSAFGAPDPKWASGFGSLLSDFLDGGAGNGFLTINNLPPGAVFNLYLYGTALEASGSVFTVGGNELTTTSPNALHNLTAGVDYVVFSGVVADGSGKITINYSGAFAGLQLQNASAGNSYTTWIDSPAYNTPTPLTAAQKLSTADPDHDGIKNLLEFVLGGNPTLSSQSILPTQQVNNTNIVFSFLRSDASETFTTLEVEISTNLIDWTSIPPLAVGSSSAGAVAVAENLAAPDAITVTIPRNGSPRKFARLAGKETR